MNWQALGLLVVGACFWIKLCQLEDKLSELETILRNKGNNDED